MATEDEKKVIGILEKANGAGPRSCVLLIGLLQLPPHSWNATRAKDVVNSCLDKGFIKVDGIDKPMGLVPYVTPYGRTMV